MPAKGQDASMLASRYLAKLIGPLFLAIGAGMLLNGQVYRAMAAQYLASYALIYVSGLFALTVGIAIVLAHNVWTANWRVIITILGWLLVIGGAVRIVIPQFIQRVGGTMFHLAALPIIGGALVVVLGLVLCNFGYRGKI
ncbi:MAG: hypothetical protein P8Y71_26100 [Pseudolabrys sp.]